MVSLRAVLPAASAAVIYSGLHLTIIPLTDVCLQPQRGPEFPSVRDMEAARAWDGQLCSGLIRIEAENVALTDVNIHGKRSRTHRLSYPA